VPPTSAAMSLSATAVIQAAPNDIAMMHSATEATTQDARLSMDEEGDCNINEEPGVPALLQIAHNLTTHAKARADLLLQCAKMRETPCGRNFLLASTLTMKLTAGP